MKLNPPLGSCRASNSAKVVIVGSVLPISESHSATLLEGEMFPCRLIERINTDSIRKNNEALCLKNPYFFHSRFALPASMKLQDNLTLKTPRKNATENIIC